eukprot:GHVL01009570.1.p1 GENE.GHVL01009570.1~~GHVL01009570.1.p1  ORF type:complete len:153 (+),score=17.38 GHVL01009570.1:322-780(+)
MAVDSEYNWVAVGGSHRALFMCSSDDLTMSSVILRSSPVNAVEFSESGSILVNGEGSWLDELSVLGAQIRRIETNIRLCSGITRTSLLHKENEEDEEVGPSKIPAASNVLVVGGVGGESHTCSPGAISVCGNIGPGQSYKRLFDLHVPSFKV